MYKQFEKECVEQFIEKLSTKLSEEQLYKYLAFNQYVTWEIVQSYPDKPWNYYFLSENPNITWEIVQANPDKPWKY